MCPMCHMSGFCQESKKKGASSGCAFFLLNFVKESYFFSLLSFFSSVFSFFFSLAQQSSAKTGDKAAAENPITAIKARVIFFIWILK